MIPILVCLVLGALLTLAVAWWFALFANLGNYTITYDPPGPGSRLSSASRVPGDFVQGTHVTRHGTAGAIRYELVTEMMWIGSRLGMMSGRQNRSIERVSTGWPMPAMEWIGDLDLRHDKAAWNWRDGLEPPIRAGSLSEGADRRLPLVPLWPGFGIDTLLYAAIVALVAGGGSAIRRGGRRRRGLCIRCAYELKGLTVCPECGLVVAARERDGSP